MDTITTAANTYTPPASSIIHAVEADLLRRAPAEPVHLVQYDDTLPIIAVTLRQGDQLYTLPSGAAVNVRMDKRDGHYIYNPALGVSSDRTVAYIAITIQMTTGAGCFDPIIEVVSGGVAGTAPIRLQIDRNPVPEDAIESEDEYETLQSLVAQAQASADAAAGSAAAAKTSQTAAAGSATAAKTSETNAASSKTAAASSASAAKTSETNAESSKTAAANSATAAAGSATAAKTSETNAAASADRAEAAANKAGGIKTINGTITPDSTGNVDLTASDVGVDTYTITVPTSGWTGSDSAGYTNTVTVSGITANTRLTAISLAPSYVGNDAAEAAMRAWESLDTQAGKVVFSAPSKPAATFAVTAVSVEEV